MPTYAYRCTACAHEFEAVQKMSDDPLTTCPECGAPIKRVIFPAGIVFKGDGWYITDSRKKPDAKAKSASASDGGEKSDSSGKASSEGKESAPAPAAEAKPSKAAAD
ncbi:MAG TPA: FmdB family zinc ribbon protein [Thermomicrobiales bacterium]|jgi:putative FmdB family regulatory protein|nr:FmdB family zinc ribbon protein [Thermomicrobiales bacterium]